ncbi:MAG TPA: hypothetical protein HPP83_06075 [Candidatus Hydrogenedentes bacterium]|nr:hypothetical protein [Candidatus Hydrogenedentota bacterium]
MKHVRRMSKGVSAADGITQAHADFALALVNLYIETAGELKKADRQ